MTFLLWFQNAKLINLLSIFNGYHPRLQFTYESEEHSSLNFLNVMVIREGNRLITNWYRKPTCSGRYINYFSNHPNKYKINTIISLVDQAILLSHEMFHVSNINIVKEILLNNCFPLRIINKHINRRLHSLKTLRNSDRVDGNVSVNRIVIPFIKGVSENLSQNLKNLGFDTVFSIPRKLNCLIKKCKDRLPCVKQTEIVYKLNCEQCNASYIGQTKRHLQTRINEHRRDIKKQSDFISVVSKHRISLSHEFNWDSPDILHRESNTRKREIAEMFFIRRHKNTINLQSDTEKLTAVYDKVIDSI